MEIFINTWLTTNEEAERYSGFEHIELIEVSDSRVNIFPHLAKLVFSHHNNPAEFKLNLISLGYPESAQEIDKRPKNANTRKGNLGEILACEYVRHYKGFDSLIYRLRYNPNPEAAMTGNDVLAFKLGDDDGNGRELITVESKVRGTFATDAVKDAYKKLNAEKRKPSSILFVVTHLRDEERHCEADKVLSFLNQALNSKPIHHAMIFLLTGNNPRDPFNHIQKQENIISNLVAVNLALGDLDDLVNAVFEYEDFDNE